MTAGKSPGPAYGPPRVGRSGVGPGRGRALRRVGVFVLLCAVAPAGTRAQETFSMGGAGVPGPTGLAVALETRLHHQLDELVSPLRYSGVGFGAGLRWGFSTEAGIRSLAVSYGRPRLTSSATEKGSHYQEGSRIDAGLRALQRVASFKDGRFSLHLGGALTGQFARYHHWYTREDKEGWLHGFGLVQPGVGWSVALPKGGLIWQEVSFPLMGVALRPGYEGLTEEPRAAWVGPGDVKGLDQSLHFLAPTGSRFRVGITYAFAGFRYSEPQTLTWTRHSLGLFVTLWRGGSG